MSEMTLSTASAEMVDALESTEYVESTQTRDRKGLFILVAILVLVAVVQAQNVFRFPYIQDSEGTNLANAQSLVSTGSLSPYTYAYNDPPLGSILIGVWLALSGGISTFGFSVNTGRVLMLIMHLATVALVYGITRKSSRSDLAATIAALIFSFSPLAVALQRQLLLENIMVVWLLMAFYLILGDHRTLMHYLASSIFYAVAVLTKGSAMFLFPAFVYAIQTQADRHHRRFARNLWLVLAGLVLIIYPLYAQMRQELFPQGWFLGGNFPHVSLLQQITDRGPDTGRFLNFAAGLAPSFNTWVDLSKFAADPVLVYGGFISVLFVLLMSLDNKRLRPLLGMLIVYGLYLCFGGQIFNTAAITLLPLLSVSLGVVLGALANQVGKIFKGSAIRYLLAGVSALVLLYPFGVFYASRLGVYTIDQVSGQIDAIKWVQGNIPKDAVIATDNYAFVELRQTFPNVQHYWKVDTDPAIRFNVLHDDPCGIDYVIATPQIYSDTALYKLDLMQRTLGGSQLLMNYPNNGWPVEIRQVSKLNCKPRTVSLKLVEASGSAQ